MLSGLAISSRWVSTVFLAAGLLLIAPPATAQVGVSKVAVLDFGNSQTGLRASAAIRDLFRGSGNKEFDLVDSDLARSAAAGVGFQGSLNLTLQDARDLGSAIGCDYYFIGTGQTYRRSPSVGPVYYESYAVIFLVSARTGRLLHWGRESARKDAAELAEKSLLDSLSSDGSRYFSELRRAADAERHERVAAVQAPARVIDVFSESDADGRADVTAPRPYRRLKPDYPAIAGDDDVVATVDAVVDLDARGEIERVEISRWAGYGLDQAVTKTVKQMHFFPAMREGVAIPIRVLLRYNFRKPPPSKNPFNK